METAGYTALGRQSGLLREMQVIANNIANASTTGFRREGIVFAEEVSRLGDEASVSMAHAKARYIDSRQGSMTKTGGVYDLAIQGEGFFLVSTPEGERLTRSGIFMPSADGFLVTPEGHGLLDAGGAPVPAPTGSAAVAVSPDGTLSVDGAPIAAIGLWRPADPTTLHHQSGTLFRTDAWEPVEDGRIVQGFVEDSNVESIREVSRMIEVQRAYELGQRFLDAEDERQRNVIRTLGR